MTDAAIQGGWFDRSKVRFVTTAAGAINRLMVATYRTRILDPSCGQRRMAGEPLRGIYAAWHSILWHGMVALRGQRVCVMVSSHRDGEIVARFLARQGFTLARGSSTRGGAQALRDFVRVARDTDFDLCVTVDGPKGPAREVKEGILFAASLTGLPIIPMGCWVDRAWRMRSWDRLIIGKPFTRAAIAFGEPLVIPPRVSREELLEVHKPRLARAMGEVEHRAKESLGGGAGPRRG